MNHAQLAVAAVIELARCERDAEPGTFKPVPHEVFSKRLLGNDRGFQEQFQSLRRAGILHGKRGPGGGYRLAMSPSKLRLSDIFRILRPDGDGYAFDSALGLPELLITFEAFTKASDAFTTHLDRVTVADALARIPKRVPRDRP